MNGTTLAAVADLVEAAGSNQVRLTAQQKLIVLDVAEDRVPALRDGLAALGLDPGASEFRRGTMACTGIEFCKLAIVETKGVAASTIDHLERALPSSTLHCRCTSTAARTRARGSRWPTSGSRDRSSATPTGESVEGFQVHLGGSLGPDAAFGRKPRGLKVTSAELPLFVERVAGRYLRAAQRSEESFASWAQRADEADLA